MVRPVSKYEVAKKKARLEEAAKPRNDASIPSSVIVNFTNREGDRAGAPIDLPISSTTEQLQKLVNSLLDNDGALPYAFYINDVEVVGSLLDAVHAIKDDEKAKQISFEDTLTINYQPLSVFRVRPVTRCVETMPGHTDAVIHISYSPDGKRLASGGGDMCVRFWNVVTSMPTHTCSGHKHHVLCTGWTPNGKNFVSADRSGEIRMWDPATGQPVGNPMRGHKKWVTSLAFEPLHLDGTCQRMASSSKDNTTRVSSCYVAVSVSSLSA
jgi:ribosome assembly protein 4